MAMKESEFQGRLIEKLKTMFPGCLVLKNDPNYIQGIPDLTVLHENHWALLEVKRDSNAKHRPNQDFYISKANEMSFSAFIDPDNKEEVLNAMEQSFKGRS